MSNWKEWQVDAPGVTYGPAFGGGGRATNRLTMHCFKRARKHSWSYTLRILQGADNSGELKLRLEVALLGAHPVAECPLPDTLDEVVGWARMAAAVAGEPEKVANSLLRLPS